MTILTHLLSTERILFMQQVASKKRSLELLSELLAMKNNTISKQELFEDFIARERLGSTGIGHGIAIPHVRSSHASYPIGALLYIKEGVEFCAIDKQLVNIVFALLVPKKEVNTHLEILAHLTRQFSQTAWLEQLRLTQDTQSLQAYLLGEYEYS